MSSTPTGATGRRRADSGKSPTVTIRDVAAHGHAAPAAGAVLGEVEEKPAAARACPDAGQSWRGEQCHRRVGDGRGQRVSGLAFSGFDRGLNVADQRIDVPRCVVALQCSLDCTATRMTQNDDQARPQVCHRILDAAQGMVVDQKYSGLSGDDGSGLSLQHGFASVVKKAPRRARPQCHSAAR